MGVLFGLLTALAIGASDLFGRRILHAQSPVTAAVPMQFFGILTAALALLAIESDANASDLAFGATSGLGFAIGLGCYYSGLAKASSAIMAPVVAMLSAVLPVGYSILRGSAPSRLTFVGAGLCLIGLAAITVNRRALGVDWVALRWGTVSGLGYALGLIMMIEVRDAAGMWPAVAQRSTAFAALAGVALATKVSLAPLPQLRWSALFAGIAVGLSSIFLLVGLELDPTPTLIVTSVFPAISVLVGLFAYQDEVRRAQWAGIGIVVVGIACISVG